MADHTENTLRAASKALSDVVAPSLDPNDPLAAEQLNLVAEYIGFVRDRIDDLYERERFELRHALQMLDAIDGAELPLDDEVSSAINVARATARYHLTTVGVTTPELRAAAQDVREVITAVIRASVELKDETRVAISRIVIDESADILQFERSWNLPFGFDPEPQTVLGLSDALRL